jgi:hypothetical protein
MKMRIKGDSLRLRVSRSELARLMDSGRIEETVHFAPQKDAQLTYALEREREPAHDRAASAQELSVAWRPGEVAVVLSADAARRWAEEDQVGVYGRLDLGEGQLEAIVEKDFACLDRSDADNLDTFPNPSHGAVC